MAGQYYQTTVSHGTTGVKTRTVGFQPLGAMIIAVPAPGTTMTEKQFSQGYTNGTVHTCDSEYVDASRTRQQRYTDRLTSIYKWNSGTATYDHKLHVEFDSFTATEFKYNVVIGDSAYQLLVVVWG